MLLFFFLSLYFSRYHGTGLFIRGRLSASLMCSDSGVRRRIFERLRAVVRDMSCVPFPVAYRHHSRTRFVSYGEDERLRKTNHCIKEVSSILPTFHVTYIIVPEPAYKGGSRTRFQLRACFPRTRYTPTSRACTYTSSLDHPRCFSLQKLSAPVETVSGTCGPTSKIGRGATFRWLRAGRLRACIRGWVEYRPLGSNMMIHDKTNACERMPAMTQDAAGNSAGRRTRRSMCACS
jgi:hypothetical protein